MGTEEMRTEKREEDGEKEGGLKEQNKAWKGESGQVHLHNQPNG